MKKALLTLTILFSIFLTISCSSEEEPETLSEWRCGTHNGKELWTGPRGGCYYYNSNHNKTYVDRSECNC